ncbi:MAG TPA: hybrid sensor histidine kinase/response regulator, partial [Vicinamibacterales bacterium]|nr:hybrid sensor histidine kinase/response regulator [Vicinamibacterales bacterium]
MATKRAYVLIVDDQARNLDALEAMLMPLDCGTVRAQSAEEALLQLLRHDFAAIVLDIRMPVMDGFELARLIKQRRRTQHVPILFLTAHLSDERDALQGYGAGAVDYLSKPINPDILRSKVGVFVDLFQKTRALAEANEALQREMAEKERAQQALQIVNADLERRVSERTAALSRAHQGVRENEERLRMAVAIAQIAPWEWHLPSGDMRWSTDPEALFGFPRGAFGRDRRTFHVLHPDDRSRIDAIVSSAIAEQGEYEAEYRIVKPDGAVVWITERGRMILDENGMPARMLGVSRDITAEREAAQEREQLLKNADQAREEAERQSRLKDEFLATLSHELRTPMNAILGWLSILEAGKPLKDVYSVLSVIRRNAEIQATLIDDLLDMNRLLAGDMRIEVETVDLGRLVQATLQALQPAADRKGVQLIASVASAATSITGDSRRLQQVLWNLLNNAIKFTNGGGRVEIRIERIVDSVQITVQDNGQGITPEFLPHVFERFRQQDPSATRAAFGLGLGLSIAKHLVELHGGRITAASDGSGCGATFIVDLP